MLLSSSEECFIVSLILFTMKGLARSLIATAIASAITVTCLLRFSIVQELWSIRQQCTITSECRKCHFYFTTSLSQLTTRCETSSNHLGDLKPPKLPTFCLFSPRYRRPAATQTTSCSSDVQARMRKNNSLGDALT